MGLGLHPSKISLLDFYLPHMGVGPAQFHACDPTTNLDGCGFLNSVVVRLPFNLISDGLREPSEGTLF